MRQKAKLLKARQRRDLAPLLQEMKLLWFNAITQKDNQQKVNIQIIAEGLSKDGKEWNYGVELNYGNPESAYCKPLDIEKDIPEELV